jgi:hypothetical protein
VRDIAVLEFQKALIDSVREASEKIDDQLKERGV